MGGRGNDSSDDEDIFTRGGVKNHLSMYTALSSTALTNSDSEDDDDAPVESLGEIARRNKLRGRPRKRQRGDNHKDDHDKSKKHHHINDKHNKKPESNDENEKTKPTSVFDTIDSDSDDDDEIQFVSSTQSTTSTPLKSNIYTSSSRQHHRLHKRYKNNNDSNSISLDDDDDDDNQIDMNARLLLERARSAARAADEARIVEEADRAAREEIEIRQKMEQLNHPPQQKSTATSSSKDEQHVTAKDDDGTPIVLKVRCGKDMMKKVRIKSKSNLLIVVKPFCKQFQLDARRVYMQVDGETVEEGQTPDDFDLEDNMVVDLYLK